MRKGQRGRGYVLKKKMAKLRVLSLLRCDTMSLAANRKTVILHFRSQQYLHSFIPEDQRVRTLRNVVNQSPNDTESHSKIHDPSVRPQW